MTDDILLGEIAPHIQVYRDATTGLAYGKDGSAGIIRTIHPNIAASGSAQATSTTSMTRPWESSRCGVGPANRRRGRVVAQNRERRN